MKGRRGHLTMMLLNSYPNFGDFIVADGVSCWRLAISKLIIKDL